ALQEMRLQESNRLAVAREVVREEITSHIQWLDNEIKNLVKKIRDRIDDDPDLKQRKALLESIAGVGERTISTLLAFSLTPGRFKPARQVTAYAGLHPRQHESGSSLRRRPHLSRCRHSGSRKVVYMPATHPLYRTAWGKHFLERL